MSGSATTVAHHRGASSFAINEHVKDQDVVLSFPQPFMILIHDELDWELCIVDAFDVLIADIGVIFVNIVVLVWFRIVVFGSSLPVDDNRSLHPEIFNDGHFALADTVDSGAYLSRWNDAVAMGKDLRHAYL